MRFSQHFSLFVFSQNRSIIRFYCKLHREQSQIARCHSPRILQRGGRKEKFWSTFIASFIGSDKNKQQKTSLSCENFSACWLSAAEMKKERNSMFYKTDADNIVSVAKSFISLHSQCPVWGTAVHVWFYLTDEKETEDTGRVWIPTTPQCVLELQRISQTDCNALSSVCRCSLFPIPRGRVDIIDSISCSPQQRR